jgi:hypothetical protein
MIRNNFSKRGAKACIRRVQTAQERANAARPVGTKTVHPAFPTVHNSIIPFNVLYIA